MLKDFSVSSPVSLIWHAIRLLEKIISNIHFKTTQCNPLEICSMFTVLFGTTSDIAVTFATLQTWRLSYLKKSMSKGHRCLVQKKTYIWCSGLVTASSVSVILHLGLWWKHFTTVSSRLCNFWSAAILLKTILIQKDKDIAWNWNNHKMRIKEVIRHTD